MNLVDEYRAQFAFRDWETILAAVPVRAGGARLARRGRGPLPRRTGDHFAWR